MLFILTLSMCVCVLSTFSTHWISLFSHSLKTKAHWRDLQQTNKAMASLSKTQMMKPLGNFILTIKSNLNKK